MVLPCRGPHETCMANLPCPPAAAQRLDVESGVHSFQTHTILIVKPVTEHIVALFPVLLSES
jgi:hypothetical protein